MLNGANALYDRDSTAPRRSGTASFPLGSEHFDFARVGDLLIRLDRIAVIDKEEETLILPKE